MAFLLFSGDLDFTISELGERNSVTFQIYNHATESGDSVYADKTLDMEDVKRLNKWLAEIIVEYETKSKTPS